MTLLPPHRVHHKSCHVATWLRALHPGNGRLLRDGQVVPAGQRGLSVLDALLAANGEVVTKAELLELAWPGTIVEEGNLSVPIASLRKALGQDEDGRDWILPESSKVCGLPVFTKADAIRFAVSDPGTSPLPAVQRPPEEPLPDIRPMPEKLATLPRAAQLARRKACSYIRATTVCRAE